MALEHVLVKQLGALPVRKEDLDRLHVRARVDALAPVREVAHLTNGQIVEALVVNRLTAPRPLYDSTAGARTWAVEETFGMAPE